MLKSPPKGDTVLLGFRNGQLQLHRLSNGSMIVKFSCSTANAGIQSCALSSDGERAYGGYDNGIIVTWDTKTRAIKSKSNDKTPSRGGRVQEIVEIPNPTNHGPKMIVSVDWNGAALLWDAADGSLIHEFANKNIIETSLASCAVSPNGAWLAAVSHGGEIFLWNLKKHDGHDPITRNSSGRIYNCAFSPDGAFLFVSTTSGNIQPWECICDGSDSIVDLQPLDKFGSVRNEHQVKSLAAAGRWLVSARCDGRLGLYDVATRKQLVTLLGPGEQDHEDPRSLDRLHPFWAESRQKHRVPSKYSGVAVSLDGSKILSWSEHEIQVALWAHPKLGVSLQVALLPIII